MPKPLHSPSNSPNPPSHDLWYHWDGDPSVQSEAQALALTAAEDEQLQAKGTGGYVCPPAQHSYEHEPSRLRRQSDLGSDQLLPAYQPLVPQAHQRLPSIWNLNLPGFNQDGGLTASSSPVGTNQTNLPRSPPRSQGPPPGRERHINEIQNDGHTGNDSGLAYRCYWKGCGQVFAQQHRLT